MLLISLPLKAINGPEKIFPIPNLKKEVKAYVADGERREVILVISKEAKKSIKTMDKVRKQKLKKIKKALLGYPGRLALGLFLGHGLPVL